MQVESYVGEIRMFAGTFAPKLWAFCDGQILSVNDYQALFSLLGTTYGGDGRLTFKLPDLRGRVVMSNGQGDGLSNRAMGQMIGNETVSLLAQNLPPHRHELQAVTDIATEMDPQSNLLANTGSNFFYENVTGDETTGFLSEDSVMNAGQGAGHYNMMPYLTVNYIICLIGEYPQRQ